MPTHGFQNWVTGNRAIEIKMPGKHNGNTYPTLRHTSADPSLFSRLRRVVTWQRVFQITVASVTFVAGAGVGREVLHDPLATAEGVLNFPVIVSQVALICVELFLDSNKTVYSWNPFDVLYIIEHISILGASFALFSSSGLNVLFSLGRFPASVETITSYGGAALIHGIFIAVHTIQASVMKWDALSWQIRRSLLLVRGRVTGDIPMFDLSGRQTETYLKKRSPDEKPMMVSLDDNLKDAIRQSREILSFNGMRDPLCNIDVESDEKVPAKSLDHVVDIHCVNGHLHGTGFAAIVADIIAHSVSLPTFTIAWLLQTAGKPVNALAVSWVAEISTLILLICLMHMSIHASAERFQNIGYEKTTDVEVTLRSRINETFMPKFDKWIDNVQFEVRRASRCTSTVKYVSFFITADPSQWLARSGNIRGSSSSEVQQAEMSLRRLALEAKAFDLSHVDERHDAKQRGLISWVFPNIESPVSFLPPISLSTTGWPDLIRDGSVAEGR